MRQRFAPGVIDYNGPMAAAYNAGRTLSPEAAATWRAVVAAHIPPRDNLTIVDLGAGTGRFSSFLAENFAANVIGVEPAARMRSIATAQRTARLTFVAGTAEAIPLSDASCDVIWMSQVLHHVRDHVLCVQDMRRVLRPDGRVLVRGTFAEGRDDFPTLFRFFPAVAHTFDDLPHRDQTIATFAANGLSLVTHQRVKQQICASLREFAARTKVRADSSLAILPDAEFAAGMEALETAASEEVEPVPINETLDLLVFQCT